MTARHASSPGRAAMRGPRDSMHVHPGRVLPATATLAHRFGPGAPVNDDAQEIDHGALPALMARIRKP